MQTIEAEWSGMQIVPQNVSFLIINTSWSYAQGLWLMCWVANNYVNAFLYCGSKMNWQTILNTRITWTSTCNKHQMSQINVSFIQYYCKIEKEKSDFKWKQFFLFVSYLCMSMHFYANFSVLKFLKTTFQSAPKKPKSNHPVKQFTNII